MRLLDRFRKSKLAVQKEDQPIITPYQETILQEYEVKFKPTLASIEFDNYIKIEQPATFGSVSNIPTPVVNYLVAENGNFLITENNSNLIV